MTLKTFETTARAEEFPTRCYLGSAHIAEIRADHDLMAAQLGLPSVLHDPDETGKIGKLYGVEVYADANAAPDGVRWED
jgi:hypothetical protein